MKQAGIAVHAALHVLLVGLVAIVGCGRSAPNEQVEPPPKRPLRAMNSAIRRGQWNQAWEFSDAVLETHPDDAEAIATVARVAYETGNQADAADLLARACRAESYRNPSRVQQAMIAMIGVGRLHDGMAMLDQAVETHPDQHQTRRLLYDFLMGTEDRNAGLPHGRVLVRQRKFDLELLQTLSNTERRTQDSTPLEEMTARNPADKRPLIGEAKTKFDLRDYDGAVAVLESIVQSHGDYYPAQALLGRSLAAAGDNDRLEKWAVSQEEQITEYVDYWIAMGDWARSDGQLDAAARAYWEATRRDVDVMEAWSKLHTTLVQLTADGSGVGPDVLAGVQRRSTLLSRFNQLKNRFERTGGISRAIVIEIVETLHDLGRLWEAEAWAAIALTLPEDDEAEVEPLRNKIVAELSSATPWQVTENHPEFRLDLASLELPSISIAVTQAATDEGVAQSDVSHLHLVDEADRRGLKFFGRTGDRLHVPGIMLYQTLGCGGGTIDFDLDGWSDLYLVAAGGTPPRRDSAANALMRNLQGDFVEVGAPTGTDDTGFGQGVAVGDVNDDGFDDLLVLNYGPNSLYINNGDGTFSNHAERLGTNGDDWSTSAAIADVDGDGITDVVIVNYCAGLEPVTKTCASEDSIVLYSCTPVAFPALADLFLKGTSEAAFVDRTAIWGAEPTVRGRGLGIVAGALDDKPGNDVFVANDMTNNHFWSGSPGKDTFSLVESAMLRGLGADDRSLAQGSMGIATADLNNDGHVDFYVTNFSKEYNTYHEHRGAGIWQDQTSAVKLAEPTMGLVGFGTEAVDLDNDGSLELIVTNGHVDLFSRGIERALYAQRMQIFRRNDAHVFDSIAGSLRGEYISKPHVGRALWTIDANRDGRVDIAVTHQTEPLALLVNHSESRGKWLAVKLVGRNGSRGAVGAVVEVSAGERRWSAPQISGDGYMCSNERTLRFGLGELVENRCDIKVRWPDGTSQSFDDVMVNGHWLLVENDPSAWRLE